MLTLYRLSLPYRVLYTAVLVFMTTGTAVHAVHQHVRTGISPQAIAAWYLGNADDPAATTLLFERAFDEVMGDVWLASNTYVIAFLIFAAVTFRASYPMRIRAALLAAFALGGTIATAAPLLVRYVSPVFAWGETAALVALPIIACILALLAIHEMWRRRTEGPRFDPSPGA